MARAEDLRQERAGYGWGTAGKAVWLGWSLVAIVGSLLSTQSFEEVIRQVWLYI